MRPGLTTIGFIDEIQDGDLTGCGSRTVMTTLVSSIDRLRFIPIVFTPAEGLFATAMRKLGAQVRVGTLPLPHKLYRPVGRGARPVLSGFAMNILGGPALVRTWANEFKAAGLDLAYLSTIFAHVAGSAAARLAGIPAVCHIQGELQASQRIKLLSGPYRIWCKTMGAQSVAISKHVAESASVAGFMEPQIIYNGIDTEKFKTACDADTLIPTGVRKQHVVGLVSAVSPLKRLDLLPEVAAKVIQAIPDTEFVVVGQPSSQAFIDSLKAATAASGLQEKVIFKGALNNLQDIYPTFDVLLHLAAVEGFGMVIAEAMSCGCPVVAINRGGPSELVENSVTGLLVDDPDDTTAIAGAVVQILTNREKATAMGAAGRARIEQMFSQKTFTEQFEQLFDQMLRRQVV
jgi:glycosyltransferase involved in cell wall biosynthesis